MWLTFQLILVQLLNLVPLLHTALQKAATTAFQPHIADRIVFPNLHGRAHNRGRVPQLNLHCHLRELRRTPCRLDRCNARIMGVVGDEDGVSVATAGVAMQNLNKMYISRVKPWNQMELLLTSTVQSKYPTSPASESS